MRLFLLQKVTTLVAITKIDSVDGSNSIDESLFALIAQDIQERGYSIRPTALPEGLANTLYNHQQALEVDKFNDAGIGRGGEYLKNEFVRTDAISWITNDSDACCDWLNWTGNLQTFLNRRLFLGLFSFESHFAHYGPGDYYKRHYDAFRGESNRVLSVVVYFNTNWAPNDGGELVLYQNEHDKEGTKVVPLLGTIVTFLSEEFPHEVLAAKRDRYSIAGWFRVNTSVSDRVDPPL
ncbi:2OG-Fe(II) oxygenase [Shewanella donghaensis]|uniref:2OG-Fe(II) oxygenase n=1 Tax=Shewanella donghaensis TaxID=238836 RepID=UPI0011829C35|nr:2OG-Fe(II) oxygenase [Shewanella donghaensis]